MYQDYWIDEKGIGYTERVYHDDVEYHYLVKFGTEDTAKQFETFKRILIQEGMRKRSGEIKAALGF